MSLTIPLKPFFIFLNLEDKKFQLWKTATIVKNKMFRLCEISPTQLLALENVQRVTFINM